MPVKPVYKMTTVEECSRMFRAAYENAIQGLKGGPVVLKLDRENRSNEQNRKLWPMLTVLSKQVQFAGKLRSKDDWKVICYQAWQETEEDSQLECVPSLSGRTVIMLGCSTSSLNKKEFAALIECIYSIGDQYDVNWSEKSIDYFAEYGIH